VARLTPVQLAALLAGAVLALLGILGLVPGVTQHHLALAGHGTRAELFGTFRMSVLLDLIHLALGLSGLALARTAAGALAWLRAAALALLVLWLLGLLDRAHWLPASTADNWLHLGLAAALLALAGATARGTA